jgi:cation transporter-like permease
MSTVSLSLTTPTSRRKLGHYRRNQQQRSILRLPHQNIFLVAAALVLLLSLNFTSAHSFRTRTTTTSLSNMAPKSTAPSASALGELKETIQSQAQEIQRLQAELKQAQQQSGSSSSSSSKTKAATAISHGGGGHGAAAGEEDVAHYLSKPFFQVSLQRVGWLGLFLSSLSMTALIMNVFESTLEKHIELAYFVPLLAGHGGNTGGQTVGTVLSALSAGTVKPAHAPQVVLKEAMAGVMSGLILGALVSPVAFKVMGVSFHVALVLFFTLPLVSMVASTLGSLIPFACVLLGLDPSVIAAPAMTSIVDVTGLMSYFLIANQIFKFYGLEL